MKLPILLLALMLGVLQLAIGAVSPTDITDANHTDSNFVRGADLSMLEYIEGHGVHYLENGQYKDALTIFKDHGCNAVRLRLFVRPDGSDGQVNSLPYTLALAKRVKHAGLLLLLDFHYSDGWADPAHQNMPKEWNGLSHRQLVERVFNYTHDTLLAFANEGCSPDLVQVGNEIKNGMMWPDGGPLKDDAKFDALLDLVKAGICAVRNSDPTAKIKVIIHVDQGANQGVCKWFFDNCQKRNLDFDMIGLSYYPFGNDSLDDLTCNLAFLSKTYSKPIMVVETGYNATGRAQRGAQYSFTPEGQKAYLQELVRVIQSTPNGRGAGFFYWAPEWIMGEKWEGPKWSHTWEERALFDHSGNMLPAMEAYHIDRSLQGEIQKLK